MAIRSAAELPTTQTVDARTTLSERVKAEGCVGRACGGTDWGERSHDAPTIPRRRNTLWDCAFPAIKPDPEFSGNTGLITRSTVSTSSPLVGYADWQP